MKPTKENRKKFDLDLKDSSNANEQKGRSKIRKRHLAEHR